MKKRIPVDELQEIARQMTFDALKGYDIPNDFRSRMTLGMWLDGEERVFELYVPESSPVDAIIISRAHVNEYTGKGKVEVLLTKNNDSGF